MSLLFKEAKDSDTNAYDAGQKLIAKITKTYALGRLSAWCVIYSAWDAPNEVAPTKELAIELVKTHFVAKKLEQ